MENQSQINIKKRFLSIDSLEKLIDFISFYQTETKRYYGIRHKDITYILFSKKAKYKTYQIPKKRKGEFRIIEAPIGKLSNLQKIIKQCLELCFIPKPAAHGFVKDRSIVTNAKRHVRRKFVYNIDLENFFPTIHFGRIYGVLQRKPFNFSDEVARYLANICCNDDGKLPQGAPTSPIISNLICRGLDRKLCKLAKEKSIQYSRYADDITFSGNLPIFKEDFTKTLIEIIETEGFSVNMKKQRLQSHLERQEVTGLRVNKKLNVSKKFLNRLRLLIKLLENGEENAQSWLEKNYEYRKRYQGKIPDIENVIRGMLDFLKMVVGNNDKKYQKLNLRFERIFNKTKFEVDDLRKAELHLQNLLKEIRFEAKIDSLNRLLIQLKIALIKYEKVSSSIKSYIEAERIFKEKIQADQNPCLIRNLDSNESKNPILSIDKDIRKINLKESRNQSPLPPENPQHLSQVLQLFSLKEPFKSLVHSSETLYSEVLVNAKKEVNNISGILGQRLPNEMYNSIRLFLDMLNADRRIFDFGKSPYSVFFKKENHFIEGFKR